MNYWNNFCVESLPLKILEQYVKRSEGHDKSNAEIASIINLTTRLLCKFRGGMYVLIYFFAFPFEYHISSSVALHFFKHICI